MLFLVCLLATIDMAATHGRLISPPARSCMWRYGFQTPRNYDDNALFCGGRSRQWDQNNGKCGVCGDAYDDPSPRSNEAGGKYSTGTISGYYTQGQVMEIQVEVTANHGGYFEFRLCPLSQYMYEANQPCLDRYQLILLNNKKRFHIPPPNLANNYTVQLQLPEQITCKRCVLQWKWVTANSWGCDEKMECCIGCGPQEHFVNCADISIRSTGHPIEMYVPRVKLNYRPTATHTDKKTILVTNDGQEIRLTNGPRLPEPQQAERSYQSWTDTGSSRPRLPEPQQAQSSYQSWTDNGSYRPRLPEPQQAQSGNQPWMASPIGVQPQVSLTRNRVKMNMASATQDRLYSTSGSSFAMTAFDPHSGQDYSSSRGSGTRTATSSRYTSTAGTRPKGAASSDTNASSPGSPDVSLAVLSRLAAIMKRMKPATCQAKYKLDAFNVNCDRICVPSGNHCTARRLVDIMDTACRLMCTVVP